MNWKEECDMDGCLRDSVETMDGLFLCRPCSDAYTWGLSNANKEDEVEGSQ